MNSFKDYFLDLTEKVIVPDGLNIDTKDIEKLNKKYQKFGFNFKNTKKQSSANYTETGEINVKINPDEDLRDIDTLINHEIIHQIQDKKSGGKMSAYNKKLVDQIKNAKGKRKEELIQKQQYENAEDLMAYSYMLVRDRKKYNIKSPEDVVKFMVDWVQIKNPKLLQKLKNYANQYWVLRNKL